MLGKHYQYFVELTERVEQLRRRLAERHPGGFVFRGLDLSHAFARQMYFAAAGDDALYRLWAQGEVLPSSDLPAFSSGLPHLLARDWFGSSKSRTAAPPYSSLQGALRPLRLLAGRGGFRRAHLRPSAVRKGDVLLFAHSLRFARFLAPIADRLGQRGAFLVNATDTALRTWLAERGYAAVLYHPAGAGPRRAGAMLARFTPGLALFAEEIEAALRAASPRVVLVPEGNAPADEIVSQVGRQAGIPVVCLQQGWSPLVHTGFRNMHYARMMVWGEGFADLLRPHNPDQAFFAAGNIHLPAVPPALGSLPDGVAFFCQGAGSWTGDADEPQLIDLAMRIAAARPGTGVHVRSHPVAPFSAAVRGRLEAFANIHISDPARESLADVLAKVSTAVSIYSSTILESIAMGVVPVIYNMTTMPRYMPDVAAMGAGVEVRAFDDAYAALLDMVSSPASRAHYAPAMRHFAERHFPRRGELAVAGIVAELENIMRTE